ncbi:hypothetical protein UF36_02675, partial [Vibrio parahaemolyticus]|uniref:hypothetical protein n=1 Tax=Vibrio parahaemolyticus TaxID=670 RepID=UPI00062B0DC2
MQHLEETIPSSSPAIEAAEALVALVDVRVSYRGKLLELSARLQILVQPPRGDRRWSGQEFTKRKDGVQRAI